MEPSQPSARPAAPAEARPRGLGRLFGSVGNRTLAGLLAGLALLAYSRTMSWTAFPGAPTQALLEALGWSPKPGVLAPLWNTLMGLLARFPGLPLPAASGAFAALCGAGCVYLAVRWMDGMGYRRWLAWTRASEERERQARRLSGLVAGLYLAGCIPFWVAATRSLPATFHLLLLLLAGRIFTAYQRRGRRVHLGLLGLLAGAGMVESATFIVFLPLLLGLLGVELYRWRCLGSGRAHAVFWGGLLAGLAGYAVQAVRLVRNGAFASPLEALGAVLAAQFDRIVLLRHHPGFLVLVFFCVVPWLLLFALSRRSPWFYEVPQVLVRLAFLGGLLAVLANLPFAPWRMLGMHPLLVTPYLLFAVCTGYMAGEFWILGEPPPPGSHRWRRGLRHAAGAFAALLPVLLLAAAVRNGREADGRHGAFVQRTVEEILARLGSRDVFYSAGPFDDSLRLACGQRHWPLRIISLPRTDSPTYLRHLAELFTNEVFRSSLLAEDFARFHKSWMLSAGALARTAAADMPDAFRAYACPVPDGLLYRLEPSLAETDWPGLAAAQTSLWAWLEGLAARPLPARSLARPEQNWIRAVGAKTANNLGVLLAEQGERAEAIRAFRSARRIFPENLSALMNLLELSRTEPLPEAAALEAEWEERRDLLRADRWLLSGQHGYLWNASDWVARGFPWALSGQPLDAGPMARRPHEEEGAGEADLRAQWIDQAYLRWGQPPREEWMFRNQLGRNGRDTGALMELARLALRRGAPDVAEIYMTEALAMGLPEADLRFDRALAAALRGDRPQAVGQLKELAHLNPGDARVWSALLRLAEDADPVRRQALRALRNQPKGNASIHLVLAWEHLLQYRWKDAEAELDRVIQISPRHRQAWELMVVLGQLKGKPRLIETGTRILFAEDPQHPLEFVRRSMNAAQRGQPGAAEAELLTGLQHGRNPDLLNALASLKISRNEDGKAVRALVDEAVAKRPFHPVYRCARIDLELREGHLDAAWKELQVVRKAMPEFMPAALLAGRILTAQGNAEGVHRLVENLKGWRKSRQTPEQRKMLEEVISQMEERP